jgi:hypothetical protein
MKRLLVLLTVGTLTVTFALAQAAPSKRYDLGDLDAELRAELWRQLDIHAAAVAMLNYCQRPPLLEQRLGEIAANCVTASSWAVVESRFESRLRVYRNRWDCGDPGTRSTMVSWERRLNALVRAAKRACRWR